MSNLFTTGIRPLVDQYLLEKGKEVRDYGQYWSASSAGLCMRLNIFRRLQVPPVAEDARKQRVFTAGHIFHEWMQDITKAAGISTAQELELQDEGLMIRGHIDDLVLVEAEKDSCPNCDGVGLDCSICAGSGWVNKEHLILYDYKTQNSRAFSYKRPKMSHYHKMQLGTYMYMLRKSTKVVVDELATPLGGSAPQFWYKDLTESRILKISKDDLRMTEEQLLWSDELGQEVVGYWKTLNGYWERKEIPKCTCADYEGGFLAKEAWNDYFWEGESCSIKWYERCKKEGLLNVPTT